MDWFRSWHGAPTDLKWPVVADKAREILGGVTHGDALFVTFVTGVTWALLDHASQGSPRGSIQGFSVTAFAKYAGATPPMVNAVIQALHEENVLKDSVFANWAKRQSSDSAERMRKLRERRKEGNVTDVTERASQVLREDKRRDSISPRSNSHDSVNNDIYSGDFETLWDAWRPFEMVKGNKPPTFKAYVKAIKSGATLRNLLTAADSYCRNCARLRTKTQHLSTWLNQRGWESVEAPPQRPVYGDPMNRMPSPAGG